MQRSVNSCITSDANSQTEVLANRRVSKTHNNYIVTRTYASIVGGAAHILHDHTNFNPTALKPLILLLRLLISHLLLLLLARIPILPSILHLRLLLRARVPSLLAAGCLCIAILRRITHRIRRLIMRLPIILMLRLMMLLVIILRYLLVLLASGKIDEHAPLVVLGMVLEA